MKKLILFLVSIFTVVALDAKTKCNNDSVKFDWSNVIHAIAKVESGHNPKAVSKCKRYVGYLQISTGMVNTCNGIAGYKKYTSKDRYSKEKSIAMFIDYQAKWNPENNIEKAIRMWNSGDPGCMKRKKATNGYYKKVIAVYNNIT